MLKALTGLLVAGAAALAIASPAAAAPTCSDGSVESYKGPNDPYGVAYIDAYAFCSAQPYSLEVVSVSTGAYSYWYGADSIVVSDLYTTSPEEVLVTVTDGSGSTSFTVTVYSYW